VRAEIDVSTQILAGCRYDGVRNAEVVRRLVRHGCDIDACSERNRTALHMAVWNNRPRVVRLLLRAHCRLNVRDRYGDTPLMLSARRGYPEIMEV